MRDSRNVPAGELSGWAGLAISRWRSLRPSEGEELTLRFRRTYGGSSEYTVEVLLENWRSLGSLLGSSTTSGVTDD